MLSLDGSENGTSSRSSAAAQSSRNVFFGTLLTDELGWNVNTTYTLIKRCMKKGAIERSEPGFFCHALIPKSAVQEAETDELINKVYDGSADKLFAALLGRKKLSDEQIEQLRQIVGELE